ncbi:hypothetical protein IV203_032798 [Nitzschia inconspicua]|uniref:Uncharacterized protein n=1 Tax=Nitzschia inconspicua TaxID=303405 RepID=A0A9K3PF53_9STRA|nr:hypothetical protein IV203_032798 [Nitzschia inconspicua]
MLDGNGASDQEAFIELKAKVIYASAKIPVPCAGLIARNCMTTQRRIIFKQFPVSCGNARTVHKLQGRSIMHLVVSTWDYTDNWISVGLSRCTIMNGLFLHMPLNPSKTRGMSEEVKSFMKSMQDIKQPKHVYLHGDDV